MTLFSARSRNTERVLTALALWTLVAGLWVCAKPWLAPTPRQRSWDEIRSALRGRRPAALALARQHTKAFLDDPFGLALAAEAAAMQSEHELAMGFYRRLPGDGGRWEFIARFGLSQRCLILGKLTQAERHLQRALELAPHHVEANNRLGHLLQVEGRSWESARHFLVPIRKGKCRGDELLGLAVTEKLFRADDHLERAAGNADPPEAVIRLPLARRAIFENRSAEAERLLREVVSARPDLGEAQGRLGRIVVDRGNPAEFLQWRNSLSGGASRHPEVWFVQGLQARRWGQTEGAVACFLEALALSPNHLGANVQMAGCLEQLGRKDAAREFARRGELLAQLESTLNLLRGDSDDKLMVTAANILGQMGRYWEAAGWSFVMTRMEIPRGAPRREMRRWLWLARAEPGPNAPGALPARLLDRRDFAQPRWRTPPPSGPREQSAPSAGPAWSFVDDAERAGIRFRYEEGSTEENRLQHIFNVMGGGLGVVDYDGDGWPDLYLAQAHDWRDPALQPEFSDRLFRNLQGERFVDVTESAKLGDLSFSHGVTVGDFDQDGFPDIYVGNKGPNRLYRNNGDGTFADVTAGAGVAGNEWTTSSVFADFNGDGLPDLYVLNYTRLDETAGKECRRPNGERVACTPDLLPPEHDRFYLNAGDGSFRDVSSAAGILVEAGRGLGVVAWDFAGDGRLGLFVANDTTANYLFLNQADDGPGMPRFRNEAVVRGVAFDMDGNSQASMGVAAGDASGNGRIDLFITNFFGESNTLYSQRDDGFFDDLTRPFALRDPAFWMLGFGSQFADLDGDGWEDLIVTNGHVDQQSSRGSPDRMPPQVFHNQQGRRFVEIPAPALGPFFEAHSLGRGLAKLDWNRDGRTDIAISHLQAPFALLTNRTPPVAGPLVVRLVGRSGCREPTGATVRMKTRNAEMVRLQTAGDGFLVTNERRLEFAVPPGESAADFEVRWPGGEIQLWSAVPAGHEILLIEGRSAPVILRRFAAFE